MPSESNSSIAAQAAHSNIPTLLLVIDVNQNKIGFAWIDEFARLHESTPRKGKIRIPLQDAEQHREQIRDRILATAIAVA